MVVSLPACRQNTRIANTRAPLRLGHCERRGCSHRLFRQCSADALCNLLGEFGRSVLRVVNIGRSLLGVLEREFEERIDFDSTHFFNRFPCRFVVSLGITHDAAFGPFGHGCRFAKNDRRAGLLQPIGNLLDVLGVLVERNLLVATSRIGLGKVFAVWPEVFQIVQPVIEMNHIPLAVANPIFE